MRGPSGFVIGLAIGFAAAGCLGGAGYYVVVKKAESDVRRGWNLVPVIVYAKDVAAGEKITFDSISQRSIPEQLYTSSVVKPDSASYVVNQVVLVPSHAGEAIRWTHFETFDPKLPKEAATACMEGLPR